MTFQLDTSGFVAMGSEHGSRFAGINMVWSDLSPFTQGCIEALFADAPQPDGHKPTEAMRRGLEALAAEPDGRLAIHDFYRAMGVSNRGRYLVLNRMADRHWIENRGSAGKDSPDYIALLPWGRTALRPLGFSDLAPEALARIIADCEACPPIYRAEWPDMAAAGRRFWLDRQADILSILSVPPLTVQLGDDGKVRFAEPHPSQQSSGGK